MSERKITCSAMDNPIVSQTSTRMSLAKESHNSSNGLSENLFTKLVLVSYQTNSHLDF